MWDYIPASLLVLTITSKSLGVYVWVYEHECVHTLICMCDYINTCLYVQKYVYLNS
jgi:hypothetical protein